MCGIAGIVGVVDEANRAALDRMTACMAHRGPDAEGTWVSEADGSGWGCLLAHRRLAILDLSPAGAQPMTHASGHTLVYNGELYNFAELRRELEAAGEAVASTGDTEVLLKLLARPDGVDLARLRGMFAFGLWSSASRTLTLARDPLGMKPLYLARNPDPSGTWSLVFASELRTLLRSGLVERRFDAAATASIVWNGFVAGPTTAVAGVELLPPATVATFEGRGRTERRRRYWSAPGPESGPALAAEELGARLQESVELHLASDVPLGVFLSSGVDSSAVANLAQRAGSSTVRTFTLTFEEQALDEGAGARAIAAAIGSEHHEIPLSAADFLASMQRSVGSLDQPTFDGLNSFHMAEAVRAAGITVALVGTGGDELFGGYETFRRLPSLHRLGPATSAVPDALRRRAAALLDRSGRGGVPRQSRWAKLPAFVERADDLVALYQLSYALFLPGFQRRLLADGLPPLELGVPGPLRDELRAEVAGREPLAALSRLEQRMFLGERLLRDSDAASMAVSLELRLPLVDHVLTGHLARLPADERFAPVGRKDALRRAGLVGLDPALFERPKQGFVLPIDQWLRGALRDDVGAVLLDAAACERVGLRPAVVADVWQTFLSGTGGLYWSRIWALYVTMAWAAGNDVAL